MTTGLDRYTHNNDDTTSVTSITEEPSMSQSQEDKLVEHQPINTTTTTTTTATTSTAETNNTGTVLGDNGITTLPDVEQGTRREEEEDHPLTVAVPVSKDDSSRYRKDIPKAESYDSSTKPENDGRRRRRFDGRAICCAVLLLCAVGIPVGIIVSRNSSSSNNSNQDQLPHPRETLGIRQRMEQLVGPEKLLQSPYEKALQWITFDDPFQLTPDNENLGQRYILAYLYFATTESSDWKSCNPPSPLPQGDVSSSSSYFSSSDNSCCTYSKLISVNTENEGQFVPTLANRWLSNLHECSWAQVKCNESDQVIAIELGTYVRMCTMCTYIIMVNNDLLKHHRAVLLAFCDVTDGILFF